MLSRTQEDLHAVKISALIAHRRESLGFKALLSVHEDTPLSDVLSALRDENILSVPVYRRAEDGGKTFTGLLSVYDIMAWTVFQRLFDEL
jgi:CBS domain-containing protein